MKISFKFVFVFAVVIAFIQGCSEKELPKEKVKRAIYITTAKAILENFDELQQKGTEIYKEIDATLDATTIASNYPGLFEWIELFDNNTWFIIIIMILVAGINMITALLVLILERIPMVGILIEFVINFLNLVKIKDTS